MAVILGILFGIFSLGLVVLVHELGHLVMAKLNKVKVYSFSLGFWTPRRLRKYLSITYKGTTYMIGLIPLGGYVHMEMEDKQDKTSFASKKRWQRALILVGGVLFNFIVGYMLIFSSYYFGYKIEKKKPDAVYEGFEITLPRVKDDSVCSSFKGANRITAGLGYIQVLTFKYVADGKVGLKDFVGPVGIIHLASKAIYLYAKQKKNAKKEDEEKVKKKKEEEVKKDKIKKTEEEKVKQKKEVSVPEGRALVKPSPKPVPKEKEYVVTPNILLLVMGGLFILIAMFNILPIPPLDGGLLFILGIESVVRRDLNPKVMRYVQWFFIILMLSAVAYITINDVIRIFTGF